MPKRYLLDFEKPLVELEKQIEQIKELARDSEVDVSQQLLQLETLAARRREEIFKSLTPAQKIQVARHPQRPSTLDFVQMFCDDWIELHGDRNNMSLEKMEFIGAASLKHGFSAIGLDKQPKVCLLYTSDAADEP